MQRIARLSLKEQLESYTPAQRELPPDMRGDLDELLLRTVAAGADLEDLAEDIIQPLLKIP